MEPIVSRKTIFELATAAALRGQPLELANPYLQGSAAHVEFEACYEAGQEALEELEA
jgi:hypothetical protein